MKIKFLTKYDHADVVSPHGGKSLTDQQYRDECDINHILKQFGATGQVPNLRTEGVSGDFSDIGDFQSCLDKVNKAKDEFLALPSYIRQRFGNDPKAYVEFCLNPANVDECIRLGLREKPAVKGDTSVDVLKRIEQVVTPKGDAVA